MSPSEPPRPMPLPPPLVPPPKRGLFVRTPPAIFPAVLGLLGLGVAWRLWHPAFGVPGAVVEGALGAALLVYAFALVAYLAKMARRPGVWAEDLRTLPGRTGLSAMTMGGMLAAAILLPYAPRVAEAVLWVSLFAHALTALTVGRMLLRPGAALGPVTAALQLVFVGVIVAAAPALELGYTGVVIVLVWYSALAAALVSARTFAPLVTGREPPPLRPLHAIHLAPPSLVAAAGLTVGQTALGAVMMAWASLVLVLLVIRSGWLIQAGFSGFWSAFTFPLSAYAGAWIGMAGLVGGETARIAGGLTMVAATLITVPVAFLVLRLWARGTLATKTNAAEA